MSFIITGYYGILQQDMLILKHFRMFLRLFPNGVTKIVSWFIFSNGGN